MSRIVIHGGIIKFEGNHAQATEYADELRRIATEALTILRAGGARSAVLAATRALEDCPLFNAGTGSRIQADGEIRMSAALMDGDHDVFSGVINIQYVRNPIDIAALLARETNKVLAGTEATRYARSKGFSSHFPYTAHRLREFKSQMDTQTGTVGAVAVDDSGRICAATSTGGVGGELPGRVSDSATVAGTYAGRAVGVSCTGVGEQIVNRAAAARIACRVEDGMPLQEAVRKTINEARVLGYHFGLIALNAAGEIAVEQTRGTTLFAYQQDDRIVTFHDA